MRKGSKLAKVKLEDVARMAAVSPATVSRVLNHPEIVRQELREKVAKSIEKLSYTRDSAARALKSRRTFTIGAVVPTLGVSIFAEGVEALQNELSQHGYTLLIANSQYDARKELSEVRSLIERGVDGVVLVGDNHLPKVQALLNQRNTPFVTTYICHARGNMPAVGIDNARATYDLTRYLLGLGHRHFGVIANLPASNDRSRDRHEGILRALAEAGLDLPPSHVIRAVHSFAHGREGLRVLLNLNPLITAVVCTTDTLAIGALAEARTIGLRIPRDLSISGFDDIEIAAEYEPALTTVGIPVGDIGKLAACQLLAAIAGRETPPNAPLPHELIIRFSTGPARTSGAISLPAAPVKAVS